MRYVALALMAIYGFACSPVTNSNDAGETIDASMRADATGSTPDASGIPDGQLGGACLANSMCSGDLECSAQQLCIAPACKGSNIIFLNRNGGTYSNGADDSRTNTSSIAQGTATLVPWNMTAVQWAQILTETRQIFADFDVEIVDADPGAVAHLEIVLTGSPSTDLGPNLGGVLSISPGDCSADINKIGFIFEPTGSPPTPIPGLIAPNAALSLGLSYTDKCPDIMSYSYDCVTANPTFNDTLLTCGQTGPQPCRCSTATNQNSKQEMLTRLGANVCP